MTKLEPASLAPCSQQITTFNKGAENLGPRYTYNKNPFLPDPTQSTITSPYTLMKGGKRRRRATKKVMKRKSKKHNKSKRRINKSKRRINKSKRRINKSKRRVKKIHMKGGGHGGSPYGLPQGLVNMGREIEYGVKSLYQTAVGGQQPVNPDPSAQPLGNSCKQLQYVPLAINPKQLINSAQAEVARL